MMTSERGTVPAQCSVGRNSVREHGTLPSVSGSTACLSVAGAYEAAMPAMFRLWHIRGGNHSARTARAVAQKFRYRPPKQPSVAECAHVAHLPEMASLLDPTARGRVILVGAGPGDPGLLTVRAVAALKAADVVVHDGLIDPRVLDIAPPGAQRISVAKSRARHTLPQEAINALIVAHVKAGSVVVRLKGGDPFIFGRGGEEVEAVRAAGLPVEVIPGVSAALGCAAEAMLPLTHRDHSSAVSFVAGQCKGLAAMNGMAFRNMSPPSVSKNRTYGEWPNEKTRTTVPSQGSLVGEHTVRGNYSPQINFTLEEDQDR
eukprot:gene2011-2711_t